MLEQAQQTLTGDQGQLQALYGQYQPVIYKYMKRHYLKGYDTEDWLQEGRIVFFRTLERSDSGKQVSLGKFSKRNFESRVHSLIRHQCVYKWQADTLSISLEQRSGSAGEGLVGYLETAATDPLGQLVIQEKLTAFPIRLSPLKRQILNAYLKGYTLEEIVKIRGGISLAVRSTYDRTKAEIKYTLENEQKPDKAVDLSSKNSCKQISSMINLKFLKRSDIIFLEVNTISTTLSSTKRDLEGRIGSEIMLVVQTGRKRQTERKGILTEIYPSVLVVDLDPDENSFERVSYNYSNALTRTVEIEFIGQAI